MEELQWETEFEEQTFRNIIRHRSPELTRIASGESAVRVIPESNQRRKLRRDGVLTVRFGLGGKRVVLTEKALNTLREMGLVEGSGAEKEV